MRWSETLQESARDRLLNGIIVDLVVDLLGMKLKKPTSRLKAMIEGRWRLIDVRTLLPKEQYRADRDSTPGSVANKSRL